MSTFIYHKINYDLNMECNFTYEHYSDTLKNIKKTHKFSSYKNYSTNDVILRHDVDTSLIAALKLAQIENDLDISSTFFLYLSSEFYNSFGEKSHKMINQILDLGHKIGLHYSEDFILKNNLDPSNTIRKEIDFFEYHYNTTIEAISAHEANSFPPSMKISLPDNVENAYSEKFVKDRKYLSDSAMFWREGCFCQHFTHFDKLQILIHPMWWNENKKTRSEIMALFLNDEYDQYTKLVKSDAEKHENWAKILSSNDPRLKT